MKIIGPRMSPCAPQTDGYDSEYESSLDSVINYNINECDFSKISCVETESRKIAKARRQMIL